MLDEFGEKGTAMRGDIEAAYKALDSKGQGAIDGMRAPRQVKKGLEQLEAFIGDERVLALAVAQDLGPSIGEQQGLGAAGSLAALTSVKKSARMLVLTEDNWYQVQGGGFMSGGQPQGVRVSLVDIRDVRVRTTRSTAKMLGKERVLMVDYMRGGQLETAVCEIATDSQLAIFAQRLSEQVEVVAEQLAASERANSVGSVDEEIAKLAQLRDGGILSSDEFDAQKTKLLQS
jgi:hypothetical protein